MRRVIVVVALAAAGAAAWWATRPPPKAPPPAPLTCTSVAELARAPEGTRGRCCELIGANASLGGKGDWETGVRWGAQKPACPCGCPAGTGCPDLAPFDPALAANASVRLGLPAPAGQGLGFCAGGARGGCPHSPAREPSPPPFVGPSLAAPGSNGCVPFFESGKQAAGATMRVCEWIGLNAKFNTGGDWEVCVNWPDADLSRWAKGDRPPCPCGCGQAQCATLEGGHGLVAYCRGATHPGCPKGTKVRLGGDFPPGETRKIRFGK